MNLDDFSAFPADSLLFVSLNNEILNCNKIKINLRLFFKNLLLTDVKCQIQDEVVVCITRWQCYKRVLCRANENLLLQCKAEY